MPTDLVGQVTSRFRRREDLGLLFDPRRGTFHRAGNVTAQQILDLTYAGAPLNQIANRLAAEYGIEPDHAHADAVSFLQTLLDTGNGAADAGRSLVPVDKRFDDLLAFPLRLEIELTAACNWNCGFCYNVWKIDPDLTDRDVRRIVRSLPAKHLPLGTARRILDEAATHGCMIVRYSGGETLLHPDALEIFDHGGSLGLYQVVHQRAYRAPTTPR
jgi:hypothetical protein